MRSFGCVCSNINRFDFERVGRLSSSSESDEDEESSSSSSSSSSESISAGDFSTSDGAGFLALLACIWVVRSLRFFRWLEKVVST